jgi:hypothetical protein
VFYSTDDELKVKKKVMDLTEFKKYSIIDTNDKQVFITNIDSRIRFRMQDTKASDEIIL